MSSFVPSRFAFASRLLAYNCWSNSRTDSTNAFTCHALCTLRRDAPLKCIKAHVCLTLLRTFAGIVSTSRLVLSHVDSDLLLVSPDFVLGAQAFAACSVLDQLVNVLGVRCFKL